MKISPLAQGSGVPGSDISGTTSRGPSNDAIVRAKAIASGQEPPVQETGDHQATRTQQSLKRIKMKTQVSPDRPIEAVVQEALTAAPVDNPTPDTNEQAQVVEETKPLSPQFAALAKRQRALQVKEREVALREEALKNQPPQQSADELIARLKASPFRVLTKEIGIPYDHLVQDVMNDPGPQSIDPSVINDLVDKKIEEKLGNRDSQSEQQVLASMRRDVVALASQGDTYEAIRTAKAYDDVVTLMHRVFKNGWEEKGYEPGYVMETEDAAQIIENRLIEESIPFAQLKKVQTRLTPQQVQAVVEQQLQTPKPGVRVMKTLTNRDGVLPTTDRRSRAIAAFNNIKKG